jgi:glucose-1-phosphate cytidylyltransferase
MLTYGDGLADIILKKLLKFHKKHGKLMTMTSAQARQVGLALLN